MPYFINAIRTPKPGNLPLVAEKVQQSMEQMNIPGLVSVSVSPPGATQNDFKVVGVLPMADADAVEAFHDQVFSDNMAALKHSARSGISELCSQENLSISKVVARSENVDSGLNLKYINRTFVPVKVGKLNDMIDLLSEWGESIDHPYIYNVSVPMGDIISQVRVTHMVESFSSLESLNEKIFSDTIRMGKLGELVAGSGRRALGRVIYRKMV